MGDGAPPRWLDRVALAAYISVRVDELPRMLRRGVLPPASYHLGPRSPRWDREAVDAVFGHGILSPSQAQDAIVQDAVNAILQGQGRSPQARGRHRQGIPLQPGRAATQGAAGAARHR